MSETEGIEIREVTTEEGFLEVFPVLNQLRDHLTEESYLEYLAEMREEGYRLFALYAGGSVVSVAGVALETNFYNGEHVFVYDLVTRPERRSEGFGTRIMEFVEAWGRERGAESMTLESGLWRDDAHRFYEDDLDMFKYCYTFKKEFDGDGE